MDDIVLTSELYDAVDEHKELTMEMVELHTALDITMETEEGVHDLLSLESVDADDVVYEMLSLNSPEVYSAESIKGAFVKTRTVLYASASKAKTGMQYVAAKTIPVVKVASDKGWQVASKQYRNLTDTPQKLVVATKELLAKSNELQRVKARPSSDKIHYKLEGKSLSVTYNTPESASDIVKAVSNIASAIKATHLTWLSEVEKVGKELVKATSDHDKSYPDKTLEKMNSALSKVDFNKVISAYSAKTVNDNRFKRHDTKAGDELPGNLRVFVTIPDRLPSDEVPKAKALRVNQVRTMRTTSKSYSTPSEGDMGIMSLDEIDRCLEANIEALKTISSYVSSDVLTRLNKLGSTMQGNLDNIFFKQVLDPRWVRVNNAIYMHTGHFMKCSTEPMSSLMSQALSAIRSNITICRRHLAVYKKQ